MQAQIEKLVCRFRQIAEQRMQGLPFYNEQLQVEALGFTQIDSGYLGVLITPWFINAILLFKSRPLNPAVVGHRYVHRLPSGEQHFMIGEDEELGRYDFISLASPTGKFKTQQQARRFALQKLDGLLMSVAEQQPDEYAVHFVSSPEKGMSRRRFLAGKGTDD